MNFIKKKGGKAHASLSLSFHSSKEFSFLNNKVGALSEWLKIKFPLLKGILIFKLRSSGKIHRPLGKSFHSSKEFSFLNELVPQYVFEFPWQSFHSSKKFSFLNVLWRYFSALHHKMVSTPQRNSHF